MKTYRDPIDAILNGGRWGPFRVRLPVCMVAGDGLLINGRAYVASMSLNLRTEDEVLDAIEHRFLMEE